MIGLDTNVLVRYLAQDDPRQAQAATALIEGFTEAEPGFVSTVTLVETVWVLSRAYRMPRADLTSVLQGLLQSRELVIEQADMHYAALGAYHASTADYADAIIALSGRRAGCSETVTFDRDAAGGARMRLLSPGRA